MGHEHEKTQVYFNEFLSEKLVLLRSYSSRESSLKPSCGNIVKPTVKVEVALASLINGVKDSLSGNMGYHNI